MKAKKRWRYYCDFCRKSGGSRSHMEAHEKSCTMNPTRKCRMCHYCDQVQEDIENIMDAIMEDANCHFERRVEDEKQKKWSIHPLDKIKLHKATALTLCPACILAGIRQVNPEFTDDWVVEWDFDFKKETDEVFKIYNENQADEFSRIIGPVW